MNTLEKQQPIIQHIMMLTLLCYPILLLTNKGGMNGSLFVMLIVSLWWLCLSPKELIGRRWDNVDTKFTLAMTFPLLAVLLSQLAHGELIVPNYDGPSRFIFAIPIFIVLRRISNGRLITVVQYSFPLGAIAALCIVLFGLGLRNNVYFNNDIFRATSNFIDLIHFGDFALLLGVLSLVSINWVQRDNLFLMLLKLTGLIAGLYVSIQSGSRGGWLIIPVLIGVLPFLKWRYKSQIVGIFIAATLLLLISTYFWVGLIHTRIDDAFAELRGFMLGSENSSIGIRFQHWKAAFYMFKENPIFGVNSNGFPQAILDLSQRGIVTKQAALEGNSEAHSDILASTARLGIFGLLSSLALYFVPVIIFLSNGEPKSKIMKTSALMGVCFVFCFFIFGLTVEIFSLKLASSFYGFTLAVLLAGATSLHQDDAQIESPTIT